MKRRIAAVLAAVFILGLTACGQSSAEKQFIAMDTVISMRVNGKRAEKALQAAEQEICVLEQMLSRTREDSEVTALNQAEGAPVEISDSLCALLEAAGNYCQRTNGTFDITVSPVCDAWGFTTESRQVPTKTVLEERLKLVDGSRITVEKQENGKSWAALGAGQQIDLGGIAKGYVSDVMERLFREYGISSGTVSLGGNVYVKGTKEGGALWQVGIQDPKQPETGALAGMVGLSDAYAVTSGGYQRFFEQDGKTYHHIIDPATGYPADSGLTSVTVIARAEETTAGQVGSGTMCDALSTALFVMGEKAALEFWRNSGLAFELVLVTDDDRVIVTDGIAAQFTQTEGSGYSYETVS